MPPLRKPPSAKKGQTSALEDAVAAVTSGKATSGQKAVVSALAVALLAVSGGVYFMMRSQVRVLSPTDPSTLKDVFLLGVSIKEVREPEFVVFFAVVDFTNL